MTANDTDPDGGPKTITAASDPAHGTVVITGGGTGLTYQPDADFNGTDTFTYTLNGSTTATVTMTVTPIADIVNDSATVAEDTPTNILVLANDTFEATPAITGTTNGTNGTVAVNDNGTAGNTADDFLVYTPAGDFNGTDSFTYTVTSNGTTETGTVSVTVTPVSDAVNDSATTNEDTPVNILVQANDTFAGTTAITGTTNGTNGTVAVNDNGTPANTADDFVTYTPSADFNGTDSFTYTVTSGGTTETATVSVTVNAVADIVNDAATTNEDTAVNILVLGNDNFEGTPAITGTTNGTNGTVAVNDNGTAGNTADDFVVYTPAGDFSGTDTFTYTVTSGGVTETATVSVTVSAVADIVNDSATTNEDTAVNVAVLANDTFEGTPAITGTTNGTNGTVAVNDNGTPANTADDFVVYTPAADFNGIDSFTYTVTSGGATETATVSVTVDAVADIVNDTATTNEDTAVNVLVLGNDTFEGTEAITGTTDGTNGTVAVNDNGTAGDTTDDFVVYTPNADFNDVDSFTYTVTSGGVTETATVSVTVSAVADIADDIATTNEDTAVNVAVLANDTFEATPAITGTTNGTNGTVAVNDNGTPGNTADDIVVYTPAADFNGTDSFTYTVTSNGTTETASVSVTVTAVADIVDDSTTVNEDSGTNTLNLLANDAFESSGRAITGVGTASHGTTAINNNGTAGDATDDFVTYTTSDPDFNGTDSFTYTVTSGGVSETATASVTIAAVADIVADSVTVAEDSGTNTLDLLANDTFENPGRAITGVGPAAHGTTAINNNGTAGDATDDFVTYTTNDPDFNGTDSFTYTVTSNGTTETATVSVTVSAVADIVDDTATTNEDTAVNVLVLANDTFEGTEAITATTNGAHGTVAVNDNGTPGISDDDFVVYTPAVDFNGTDSFTYTVTSNGTAETATVSVTVSAVADIVDDTATSNEDTAVNVAVLANDTFEGTEAITATTNGTNGTVAVNDNATAGDTTDDFVVYTPAADFNGTDSFTYTVTSGGVAETATVSVTISAVQDAFDDSATVSQNTSANPINVLANDFFEGTEQVTAVTQGTSGTVAINDNGTAGDTSDDFVTYTPNTAFVGNDTFTYTVTSPTGTPETATVSVSVSPDVAPTAVTDSATVGEDTAATAINVLGNDTDPDGGPKVITTASDPVHGTVVLTGGSPGAHTGLTYQPDADFNGTETFTYTLNGGSTTTVTVTVTSVADIVNDSATVAEDSGTNNLNLLANDTFENPGRAITAVGAATHGTTAINNNNTTGDATDDFVTYTQTDADFNGTDTFTYTVTSPAGVTETASVTVTISAVADIANDNATTNEDTTVNVLVLANDTFEGTEAITGTTNGAHGTVAVNNNGTPGISDDDFVVYTPSADFNGTDTFTYTVTSGGVTETGTVSVSVSAVADIVGDSVTVAEDSGSNTLNLLANNSFENAGRSITTVGAATHGTTAINNNATPGNTADDFVTYSTTEANFFGNDSFTYTVTSNGTTETATVSVTVTPVNDAPVAADFTFTGANGAIGNTSLVVNDPTDAAPDPAGPQRTVSGDILAGATDVDTALNLLTITAETITNASGSLVIQADGDFTYLPAAGFSGNAVFTYTLNDDDPLGNATDTANITINVPATPRVWYVDPNAASNGDGTSDNPFNTLTQLNGLTGDGSTNDDVDGANDIIFIYGGTLSAGITLEDGQQLIGQSVGLTVSGTALEAASGSNPLINGAVVLASGNTIDGIDIGNASGFALSGTSIGTASFNHGSINNTTGGALSVTTGGTLNATFTNFSSSAGTNAVNLVGVNGTLNLGTGALSNASGTTFNVNGGAASITYNGTITDDVGQLIAVANHTGGTVDFNGAISDGNDGDGSGISLTGNTGATISFDGGVTLSTGTANAFTATGGGTVTVTGSTNTLTTTTGTALNVTNTTIGAADVTFRSISADGGTNAGIILDNTGSAGGLHVTGNGTNVGATGGGVIANRSGADINTQNIDGTANITGTGGTGILLRNTVDVQLNGMQLNDFSNFALIGQNVVGFSLTNSVINGTNGNNDAVDEGSVIFDNLRGTATISNTTITGGHEDNVSIQNTTNTGGALNMTVSGSTFATSAGSFANDAFQFIADGNSVMSLTLENSTFTRARGDLIHVVSRGATSSIDVNFTGNTLSNDHTSILSGGGGTVFEADNQTSNSVLTFDILNNTFRDALGVALNVFKGPGGGTVSGTISGNTIGVSGVANSGSEQAGGINVDMDGGGTVTVAITNNTIRQYNADAIHLNVGSALGPNNGTFNATVTGNLAEQPGAFGSNAFELNAGTNSTGGTPDGPDNHVVNLEVSGNTFANGGSDANLEDDINLRNRFSVEVHITGYTGLSTDTAAVAAFVAAQNPGTETVAATTSGDGYFNTVPPGSTPPQPPVTPLLAVSGGVASTTGVLGDHDLSAAELAGIVEAAFDRWASAGLSATQLAMLQSLDFSVTDLGGDALGFELPGHVLIDNDGAGFGWFVDATPLDDAEFAYAAGVGSNVTDRWLWADPSQVPAGDMDLLTAVMHEMGHALGLDDSYAAADRGDLMFGALVTGERRLPGSADVVRAGFDYSAEDVVFGASGAAVDGTRLPDLNTDFTTPNYARCGTVDVTGGDTMVMHQMA